MSREKRIWGSKIELRGADGEPLPKITGYAAVWDTPSELIYGMFREFVRKGAFTKSLSETDVIALGHHESGQVLGRKSAGTLEIEEDATGLAVVITPPNTTYARDLVENIRRGDIQGMSFGFETVTDSWYMKDGEYCRDLIETVLHEVSVVTFPAYPDTSVAVRRYEVYRGKPTLNENRLRLARV